MMKANHHSRLYRALVIIKFYYKLQCHSYAGPTIIFYFQLNTDEKRLFTVIESFSYWAHQPEASTNY